MYKILFFTTFFVLTIIAIGCGGPAAPNANSNVPVNANRNTGNSVVVNPTQKPVAPTTNDAPTLGPIVRAYYEALKKKDDAALRNLVSRDLIKVTEDTMKNEKFKGGLAAYMADTDRQPENGIEVRNEKIDGDRGTAELKGGTYVGWTPFNFVKEDGKWKMTNGSADIDAVKPSAPAPNTGK